jgi:outer membrane lipoprotein-sorting protein
MPKLAFQVLFTVLVATGLLTAGSSALQAQNKYDVLARVLQPYGELFYSKAPTKAMQADVILREGPSATTGLLNQQLRVFLQIPDKLRIENLDPQHRVVFCREGQKVWIYPRELATGIVVPGRRPDRKRQIPDFRLPLKDQQIVWIPALFQILRFESASDHDGLPVWTLDFQLSPEFARAMKCDSWTASVIVKQNDFQVQRLRIESSNWTGSIDVLSCRFQKAFPAQTWEPEPALVNEATPIPPELFESALQKVGTAAIPR